MTNITLRWHTPHNVSTMFFHACSISSRIMSTLLFNNTLLQSQSACVSQQALQFYPCLFTWTAQLMLNLPITTCYMLIYLLAVACDGEIKEVVDCEAGGLSASMTAAQGETVILLNYFYFIIQSFLFRLFTTLVKDHSSFSLCFYTQMYGASRFFCLVY